MKRMVYTILSITGVLLSVILFVGCGAAPVSKTSSALTGISLSQSHMNFNECYSFYLREEDGKVLFDAEVRLYEEPYTVILESLEVDEEYFTQLLSLDKEHSITDYVRTYKKKKSPVTILDETIVTTTVYLDDGTVKSAKSGSFSEELYEFFLQIALDYQEFSVAE